MHSRQSVENVSVSWRVPVGLFALGGSGTWEERLLVNTWVSRLLKGENVDVVVLVLLDDSRSVLVGVERVHKDEGDVDVVFRVEVLGFSVFHESLRRLLAPEIGGTPFLLFPPMGTRLLRKDCSAHLDLPNGKIKESHVVSDLDDGFGTDTTHRGTETTVQLEDGKLVEDGRVDVGEDLVSADLLRLGRLNSLPVAKD